MGETDHRRHPSHHHALGLLEETDMIFAPIFGESGG